jgi:tripartite-type tricarboxylate transporter receptor subunit TctC
MATTLPLDRRGVLRLLAALPGAGGIAVARAAAPNGEQMATAETAGPQGDGLTGANTPATLLVAGPPDGMTGQWGDLLVAALSRTLPYGARLHAEPIGTADGVTGANQFEARAVPDGSTALLLPGSAALAWLVGDSRAQFDAAQWVPVMAGIGSGVLVGRVGPGGITPGRALRIGAAGPAGEALPGLLGLDMLGVQTVPMFGLLDPRAMQAAFAQHAVDAMFLHGEAMPEQMEAAAAVGGTPVFSVGSAVAGDRVARDPSLPDVPTFGELYQRFHGRLPSGPLADAWRAAAAAVRLQVGLVLPPLTPAAAVAMWRRAGSQVIATPEVQAAASAAGLRAVAAPAATTSISAVAVDAPALLELRRWLAMRMDWHAG